MPGKIIAPNASLSEIALFKKSFEDLKAGKRLSCPSPLPQAKAKGKVSKWGGSMCFKVYLPSHRGSFTSHAVESHGVPRSATTVGQYICEQLHPVTKKPCGYQFKRPDHLNRHKFGRDGKGGKACAANEMKSDHLLGCDYTFADGTVCGRSFKQTKLYDRHLLSKDHGGPGAREAASDKKRLGLQVRMDSIKEAQRRSSIREVGRWNSNEGVERKSQRPQLNSVFPAPTAAVEVEDEAVDDPVFELAASADAEVSEVSPKTEIRLGTEALHLKLNQIDFELEKMLSKFAQ